MAGAENQEVEDFPAILKEVQKQISVLQGYVACQMTLAQQ